MNITFIPVESSNVKEIGYDAAAEALYVAFKSGTLYRYDNVPLGVYLAFLGADSYGKFFHTFVREVYDCTKIKPESILPRILVKMKNGYFEVLGSTITCTIILAEPGARISYPMEPITDAELDRLIRLEESDFPSEEDL